MGNSSLHIIADHISVIASAKTWIEGGAIQQLQTTAKLPGMRRVAGMPDLHPGRGYPVGAAFFSVGQMYPALIGGDIGCGMRFLETSISTRKLSIDKLVKRLGNLDAPLHRVNETWNQRIKELGFQDTAFEHALGTIGGGNHFVELQQFDEILDHDLFTANALDKERVMLLVHSGSRGFGGQILRDQIDRYGHAGVLANSSNADAYWQQHRRALQFADANRMLIAERICANLSTQARVILDVHHNFLCETNIDGQPGYLHRKGATPADQGLVIIPGSRGDYSYLVQPIAIEDPENADRALQSLYSLAHGAGRKWMRSECEARLSQRYTAAQLSKTRFGSHVVCQDKALIFEEAPEAYKPIHTVISALVEAGLIHPVARLKPLVSYKTSGGCCV